MRISDTLRYALGFCASVAVLGGCRGSGPSPEPVAQTRFGNARIGAGVATPIGGLPNANDISPARRRYKVLYAFKREADGANPQATLIEHNGTLYGTTMGGGNTSCQVSTNGPYGCGTVFRMSTSGAEHVLYRFEGRVRRDGASPITGLTAVNGRLYGTTFGGGGFGCFRNEGCGTIFEISTSGREKVLHRFRERTLDGIHPAGPLTYVKGELYGTTSGGGQHRCGTVFAITTSGKERVIYSFKGIPDGCEPSGNLTFVHAAFYGTTAFSGAYTAGCVFKVSVDGKESVLHSFGKERDGSQPAAGVIAFKGVLYGTTVYGGAEKTLGRGTIFGISDSGDERIIYRFEDGSGEYPRAGLLSYNGALYGTTGGQIAGVNPSHGNVFKVSTSGKEMTIHSFKKTVRHSAAHPMAGLLGVNGALYGTTSGGGAHDAGVVFRQAP